MFGLILATTSLQPLQTYALGQADQLPADASLGMVAIATNSNLWRGLPIDPLSLGGGVLLQQMASAVGLPEQSLSFDRDLRPWLGEFGALVFLLPPKGVDVSPILLLQSRDGAAFTAFRQRLEEGKQAAITEEYRGVTIKTWAPPKAGTDPTDPVEAALAIALLPDNTVIVGRHRDGVRLYLDGRDRPSQNRLSALPPFRRSVTGANWGRALVAGYGNYAALGEYWRRSDADGFLAALRTTVLSQYSHYDAMVWPVAGGIRFQSNVYGVRALPVVSYPSVRLLSRVPGDVLTVAASSNLRAQWQWVEQESKRNFAYGLVVGLVQEGLQSSLNLNLQKELLPWLTGEYAFVVYPSQSEIMDGFWGTKGLRIGFALLLESGDRRRTEAVLRKVNQGIPRLTNQRVRPVQRRLGSVAMTSFEVADRQNPRQQFSVFSYGWQENNTLLVTSGLGAARTFIPRPSMPLAQNQDFQRAIAQLPRQNYGYFYTHIPPAVQLGVNFLEFVDEGTRAPLANTIIQKLGQLKGLTVVYSQNREALTTDAFLSLPTR